MCFSVLFWRRLIAMLIISSYVLVNIMLTGFLKIALSSKRNMCFWTMVCRSLSNLFFFPLTIAKNNVTKEYRLIYWEIQIPAKATFKFFTDLDVFLFLKTLSRMLENIQLTFQFITLKQHGLSNEFSLKGWVI